MADAFHQLLDAVQHAVDVAIEPRELILAGGGRNAPVELAALDPGRGIADGGQALLDAPMEEQRPQRRHHRGDRAAGDDRPDHQPPDLLLIRHVASNHQYFPAGQPHRQHPGDRGPADTHQRLVGQMAELVFRPIPRPHIADHPGAVGADQQIDLGVAGDTVIQQIADFLGELPDALLIGQSDQPDRQAGELAVDAFAQHADGAEIEGDRDHQHDRHHRQPVEESEAESDAAEGAGRQDQSPRPAM